MTGFEIEQLDFTSFAVREALDLYPRFANWPVVYLIDNTKDIYVGETGNAFTRMNQHLASEQRRHLSAVRVVFDDRFNKSVCLDLESFLIRLLFGDGHFEVLNRNDGITNADYYQREEYQHTFRAIFEELRSKGFFARSIPEIENQDLFKLSPFKALNQEQGVVVHDIMEGLVEDLETGEPSLAVIQGDPGTGKTIVGIYLMKLLRDLAQFDPTDEIAGDSMFSDFFVEGSRELFEGLRIGMVIPQRSLRTSVQKVFSTLPALRGTEVLTAFDVGDDPGEFDVLIVDEAHRLTQFSAQSHGTLTARYRTITKKLFGSEDPAINQLDWLRAKARHTILLLDAEQSVRPSDIPAGELAEAIATVERGRRRYRLQKQMRVKGGDAYIEFVRRFLSDEPPASIPDIGDYAFELFDNLGEMRRRIRERDREVGLARLIAGYAWKWTSRGDPFAHDIELDNEKLRWNVETTDWINSRTALDEVGSIHTVQGYDLNYAGVIIGGDLRLDLISGELVVERSNYFDTKGKSNNAMRNQVTTDDDLRRYIRNVYRVLLTRGMRGTYVYIVDVHLRERLRQIVTAGR